MGPTGAGKTRLSFELARELPVEIVSVDSAMVYRGMDIGTAKPTLAERGDIPHHLIDLLDPAARYSAGQFVRDARAAIDGIRERGRYPLLVGGTMLYFHALLHGLAKLPAGDLQVRAQIDEQARQEGWAAVHAELARVDPKAAARIHPNDPQRIQRALEVFRSTGTALSELQPQRRPPLADLQILLLVADIPDRQQLHGRIAERFEAMMQAGFLEEVRALRDRGDLDAELPALRAVGYRQLWDYLAGESTLEQATQRAVTATRQLAKRQMTWLRGLQRSVAGDGRLMHWFDASAVQAAAQATKIVRTAAPPIRF